MKKLLFALIVVIAISGCDKDNDPSKEPVVVNGAGDITSKMNDFRALLGATLNTTTGQTSGRREINWDAVPDMFATQKIPSDFFNPTGPGATVSLQRGFVYDVPTDARISSNNFADLDASNANEFSAFSGNKTFSAVSSNMWDVMFEVAGETTAAKVHGFGAVFSDVDDASSTTMEFFNGTTSLGVYKVPVHTTGTIPSWVFIFRTRLLTG